MKKQFRNRKTGKRITVDDEKDKHLMCSLEASDDWQEMIYT